MPGSSVADVPVRGGSVLLGGAAFGSPVSTEPAAGPSVPVRNHHLELHLVSTSKIMLEVTG